MDNINEFREKWKHEDTLINQRLTWLLITQTILFAGYANILVGNSKGSQMDWLLPFMAIFGILFSMVIGISVYAAIFAMYDLKKEFKKNKGVGRVDTSERATKWGFFASKAMPILFIILWIAILILNLVNLKTA